MSAITIFLRYADEAAARAAFQSFGYAPGTDDHGNPSWQTDGALDFGGFRADYHVVNGNGVIQHPTGALIEVDGVQVPEMTPSEGYHVNLRWLGPAEMIPDFGEVQITPDPVMPKCLFSE